MPPGACRTYMSRLAMVSIFILASGSSLVHRPSLGPPRITKFRMSDTGTQGWRILPSLPSLDESVDERVLVSASALNSPSYLMAPNDITTQIRAASAQSLSPRIIIRASLEVPHTCWSQSGWRCKFRVAVVGSHCSLHGSFSPPLLPSAPSGPTTTLLEANLANISQWKFCSEILYPDGICDQETVESAMRSSLESIRFVFVAIDVTSDEGLSTSQAGGACSDDALWDVGFGGCSTYAPGQQNSGYCDEDGGCDACGCACAQECSGDGKCSDDMSWDGGSGGCASYGPGKQNEGSCAQHGACPVCTCSCASECSGGGDTEASDEHGHMWYNHTILLTSSSLFIDDAQRWPAASVDAPPISTARSWLKLTDFPPLAACSASRNPTCPWDACDARMQHVLAASCEGPFGNLGARCWRQPYPVRYRMELVSLQMPDDPPPTACYAAKTCIAPLPLTRRNASSAGAHADKDAELVSSERGGGRSVWFWTAPADWFVGEESGNLLGLMLQLQLSPDHAQGTNQEDFFGPISDGAPEEAISQLASHARSRAQDIVFFSRDGQAVTYALDVQPVGNPSLLFSYWVPCEYEVGKWFRHSVSPHAPLHPAGGGVADSDRLEATKEEVEQVLSSVAWLLIRGVFQAVVVGGNYVDPYKLNSFDTSNSGLSRRFGMGGVVHVTRTALRSAALLDVGGAGVHLISASPMSGPVLGNTKVNFVGGGFEALRDHLTRVSSLSTHVVSCACVWRCSATDAQPTPAVEALLTIVNDTHAHCTSPWRAGSGACSLGVGVLFDASFSVVAARLATHDFVFYVPPAISSVQPTQASAGGGTVLTVFGSGLAPEAAFASPTSSAMPGTPLCKLELVCLAGGAVGDGVSGGAWWTSVTLSAPAVLGVTGDSLTCVLPEAPCGGPAAFSLALNGVDFTRQASDCRSRGGRRTRSDGCVVQLVGKPAPSLPANGEGDDIVPLSPEEQGQGRGASAGSVIGALFGILAYVYAARWVTMLAQRRRLVRQENGARLPCNVTEAYVLWLFFGLLGAHRFYCGQRDKLLHIYVCTLGFVGVGWVADGINMAKLVALSNRRMGGDSAMMFAGGRPKGSRHIQLEELMADDVHGADHHLQDVDNFEPSEVTCECFEPSEVDAHGPALLPGAAGACAGSAAGVKRGHDRKTERERDEERAVVGDDTCRDGRGRPEKSEAWDSRTQPLLGVGDGRFPAPISSERVSAVDGLPHAVEGRR